jgi:hypothetical protein
MMIDCRDQRTYFTDFINGELDYRKTKALLNHVSGCAACSADLKSRYLFISGMRAGTEAFPEYEKMIAQVTSKCRKEGILRTLYGMAGVVILFMIFYFLSGLIFI